MTVGAGVVVTGTEVLTGRVTDRNGPWLSERLRERGIEHVFTIVVGDRPQDMTRALRTCAEAGCALVVTSGGLGPTADDLTTEIVAEFTGRPLRLDEALEGRIAAILEHLRRRWPGLDQDALRAGTRKQAMVPEGATVLEPVGTAPGLLVPPRDGEGPTILVLPGPPGELRPMWEAVAGTDEFRAATGETGEITQRTLRLFGIPESEIAETLRRSPVDLAPLEITTCLRRGEVEVVTRFAPSDAQSYEGFAGWVRERHADTLFSEDGSTVEQQVADALRERGWSIATAESCTAGLLAARLTEAPGSSAYVRGGVVVYADDAKTALAGVDADIIAAHGAVSTEVAEALADGARARLGAEIGVGITGIAGPGGGSEEKPVGTVCFSVAGPEAARLTRRAHLPGGRADVRDRSTTVALHLVRRWLRGER